MLQRRILFHSVLSGRKMLETRQILIYRSPIRSISSFLRDISKVFRGILDCIDWIDFSSFFFSLFKQRSFRHFLFFSFRTRFESHLKILMIKKRNSFQKYWMKRGTIFEHASKIYYQSYEKKRRRKERLVFSRIIYFQNSSLINQKVFTRAIVNLGISISTFYH